MSLLVTFSPIFDMRRGFKEHEGDIFNVKNYPIIDSTISPKHLHLSILQIKGYKI
jgi:hypothetical protein